MIVTTSSSETASAGFSTGPRPAVKTFSTQKCGGTSASQARNNLYKKRHSLRIVILSGVDDSRSKSSAKSKDPCTLNSPPPQQGILSARSIRTPSPTPAARRSSVADNPPSSILRAGWETPDSAAALLLRNTRPCAPSISNSSPRSARSHPQSARHRDPEFQSPPEPPPPVPALPLPPATPAPRARP